MRSCGFDWIVSLAWMCHGCGTTLASVVKMNSSIDTMQQIGSIVFPGISSIIMVNMLDIEGEVSNIRLLTFYFTGQVCRGRKYCATDSGLITVEIVVLDIIVLR